MLKREPNRAYMYIYICLFFVVYIVSSQQKIQSLFMDDLSMLRAWHDTGSSLWHFIWYDGSFKFRPIANLLMGIGFSIVGSHTEYLWLWMLVINYTTVLTVFHIYKTVIHDEILAATGACVYALSRFGYYAYGQYFGIMEQTATMFAILTLLQVFEALTEAHSMKNLMAALVFSSLATFTHERYLSLFVLVILSSVLSSLPTKKKLISVCVFAVSLVAVLYSRSAMFGEQAWAGTGGTNMVSGLEISRVVTFILHGCLYLFGINVGPAYLSGFTYTDIPVGIWTLIGCVWAIILFCIVLGLRNRHIIKNWKQYFIVVAYIGGTLIVSCTTIRLELRWLYSPFAGIILLWLMLLQGAFPQKMELKKGLSMILLFGMMAIEVFYHSGYGNIYLWDAQSIYNQIYTETLEKNNNSLAGKRIVLISDDIEHLSQESLVTFFNEYARAEGVEPPQIEVYRSLCDFDYTGDENIILKVERTQNMIRWRSNVANITETLEKTYNVICPVGQTIREAVLIDGFYGWNGDDKTYIWTSPEVSVRIATGETGNATLEATIPEFNLPNVLHIYFNDDLISRHDIEESLAVINFTLPQNVDGILSITVDNGLSPYEAGEGEDRRPLGLCIKQLSVE